MSDDDFTFLALSKSDLDQSLVSQYLESLSEQFFMESQSKDRWTVNGQSQYSSISKLIKIQMSKFQKSINEKQNKLDQVEQELEVVTDVARENIDKFVERGLKLDDLVDKTSSLKKRAIHYNIKTKNLKNMLSREKYRVYTYMAVVIIMAIIFIYMVKH